MDSNKKRLITEVSIEFAGPVIVVHERDTKLDFDYIALFVTKFGGEHLTVRLDKTEAKDLIGILKTAVKSLEDRGV